MYFTLTVAHLIQLNRQSTLITCPATLLNSANKQPREGSKQKRPFTFSLRQTFTAKGTTGFFCKGESLTGFWLGYPGLTTAATRDARASKNEFMDLICQVFLVGLY